MVLQPLLGGCTLSAWNIQIQKSADYSQKHVNFAVKMLYKT